MLFPYLKSFIRVSISRSLPLNSTYTLDPGHGALYEDSGKSTVAGGLTITCASIVSLLVTSRLNAVLPKTQNPSLRLTERKSTSGDVL